MTQNINITLFFRGRGGGLHKTTSSHLQKRNRTLTKPQTPNTHVRWKEGRRVKNELKSYKFEYINSSLQIFFILHCNIK